MGAQVKVLRIGIVQNGKIIDERELTKRETVSIGNDPKATFMVVSEALPSRRAFEMFVVEGAKYFLRFAEGMDARIQLSANKVLDRAGLDKERRLVTRGGFDLLELTDDNRGKVVIGDVTVLFQFKQAALEPERPVLPADARASIIQNMDAQF